MKKYLNLSFAVLALACPALAQNKMSVCELNKINKDVEQTIKYAGKNVEVTVLSSHGNTTSGPDLVKDHQFTFYIFDSSCEFPFGDGFRVAWPYNMGMTSGEMVKDPITDKVSYSEDGIHRHYSALNPPSVYGGLAPTSPTPFTVTGVLEQDEKTGELVLHMDSYTSCWTGGSPRRTECKKDELVHQ